MMIKRARFNLNDANVGKQKELDRVLVEARRVVNVFIKELWTRQDFKSTFVDFGVETWLSARMQQALGKQALEIVKSQRKRKKKTIPTFNGNVLNLDSRFVDVRFSDESVYDTWIKFASIGDGVVIKLPSKRHQHYNKLITMGWTLKKSCRLYKRIDGKWFVDLFVERESVPLRPFGRTIGIDVGYKKLAITSDNQILDDGLEDIYEKIARKKHGSKAFKKALVERDNKINSSLNKLDLTGVRQINAEALKSVKYKSKGKRSKEFNNKLQRWSYPKVLMKLQSLCDATGITLNHINPAYTSQTCSVCGLTHKNSRQGEQFKCVGCGYKIDADLNAAINISAGGVYSPSVVLG